MTGFGSAEGMVGAAGVSVEIRTVNHRFFNPSIKLPGPFSKWEGDVRELLRQRIARGHVALTARVEPGSTCVVFGAGMVGLGAVAGCRLQGAERIVCVDLSDERLVLARGQGATDTVVGGPDGVERVLELVGPLGADYTFEATGNVAVMRQAVESARMGWGLATMCGVAGKGEVLEVVPRFLITGRRVAGSSFGGVKGRDQVPQLVDRWLAGDIDAESFISHRITLDEVNKGFELMEAQDGIRSVIEFS